MSNIQQEVPQHLVDRVTELGGLNRFGKPNFRVVWGGNRTYLVGGVFKDAIKVKDEDGNERTVVTQTPELRTLLKYHPKRWHLEKWCGPEWYGDPEEWYRITWNEDAQLYTMGDYPSEGDYEHVFYLGMCNHMGPKDTEWCNLCKVNCGEYIPLEENFGLIERQIHLLKLSMAVNPAAERSALFGREAQRRQESRKLVQEVVQNAMRPQIALNNTSWQQGLRGGIDRHSAPEANMKMGLSERILRRYGLGFRQGVPKVKRIV